MADTHRLFVAVDLNHATREAAADAARAVSAALARRGPARRVRWVAAEQLHLTLAFMGAVPDPQMAAVTAALAPPMPVEAFTLELSGLGMFPAAGPPRVLWIGVGAGRQALDGLAAEVGRRLQDAGVLMDDRVWNAHLTIGRWRESRGDDRAIVSAAAPHGSIGRCPVDHVTLYESTRLADGPHHTALVRSPLGRPAGGER
ncbi:MAG TPA: RNA 2',3'-cyclic phosphodiesterase [Vicinamibacterales bacterium]|nr:RNA 2',3'-cyclic phosphodiesterase [Vicinamibacterales bacterium]